MGTRLTSTAWFGPKRHMGWGWTPVAWQGWVVLAVFLVLVLVNVVALTGAASLVGIAILTALLLGVTLVTGDPPG